MLACLLYLCLEISLALYYEVYLYCWGVLPICRRMMDSAFDPFLLASGWVLQNWVQWCWAILMTSDCYFLLFWYWWCRSGGMCWYEVLCDFLAFDGMKFLVTFGYSYYPWVEISFYHFSVGLDLWVDNLWIKIYLLFFMYVDWEFCLG